MGVISQNISMGVISQNISKGAPLAPHGPASEETTVERTRNAARARALGTATGIDVDFRCVLPEHRHAAQLTETPNGYWLYRCAEHDQLSLAQLRAGIAGFPRFSSLSGVLASRWLERLDYEAALRKPSQVSVILPAKYSEATARVARGIGLFLGLRDERWQREPFTFARDFTIAYCGVTNDEARWALEALASAGSIELVGKRGRSNLWRLPEGRS